MTLTQFNLWIAEIHNDRTRGASELARRSLELLAEALVDFTSLIHPTQ